MPIRHVAFFGRKGTGVSTVATNVAAALVKMGHATVFNHDPGTPLPAATRFCLYDLEESAQSLRQLVTAGKLDLLFAVSGADRTSLDTVNLMLQQLETLPAGERPHVGLIGNRLPATYADALLDDFARRTNISTAAHIPHSIIVWRSAFFGETVVTAAPRSFLARLYKQLALILVAPRPQGPPGYSALSTEELQEWCSDWGDRLFDYGEGLIRGGESI
jgi:nitrogenase subunit NifH